MKIAYFDLETQYLFKEVGGRFPERLKIAVAGALIDDKFYLFEENDVVGLMQLLKETDLIVGHNLIEFDYKVLEPYLEQEFIEELKRKTLDTFDKLKKLTGCWISLDDLGERNLGIRKLFNSIEIPKMWKDGKKEQVKEYLKRDLELTMKIHKHVLENKKLKYGHKEYGELKGEREIEINW